MLHIIHKKRRKNKTECVQQSKTCNFDVITLAGQSLFKRFACFWPKARKTTKIQKMLQNSHYYCALVVTKNKRPFKFKRKNG